MSSYKTRFIIFFYITQTPLGLHDPVKNKQLQIIDGLMDIYLFNVHEGKT